MTIKIYLAEFFIERASGENVWKCQTRFRLPTAPAPAHEASIVKSRHYKYLKPQIDLALKSHFLQHDYFYINSAINSSIASHHVGCGSTAARLRSVR